MLLRESFGKIKAELSIGFSSMRFLIGAISGRSGYRRHPGVQWVGEWTVRSWAQRGVEEWHDNWIELRNQECFSWR